MSSGERTVEPEEYQRVHREAIVIDATCPLLRSGEYLPWWVEGGATAAAPTVGGSELAGETLRTLAAWMRRIQDDPRLVLVRQAADIEAAKAQDMFGVIFHFQGVEPLEDDLDLVDAFQQLGVGMIQLAYNVRNRAADGCEEPHDAGLSRFGVKLIQRLNEENVIIDCSHTGERTTMEAIELSKAPVVLSHCGVRALKDSPRNATDAQIKAIVASGGLIGVNGFPAFVSAADRPTLDEFIDHIDYVVALVGIDHVGLGIDYFRGQAGVASAEEAAALYNREVATGRWDPGTYPPPPYHYPAGIETPQRLPNLTKRLLERGYAEADVHKILGGNWLRVFREVWGA